MELKAGIQRWLAWLGVAVSTACSLTDRAVGLVAFKGSERENGCGFGFSDNFGADALNEGSSVRLFPEIEVVSVFESGWGWCPRVSKVWPTLVDIDAAEANKLSRDA